ncbi:RluA family pseudouridine synthase [Bacillus badius]|uniref:Pseudouridine synthase n=1 Tax=Bacillus badius TaxID=1455 RepID=A0ABR5ASF0_BACBA|nr:RluA family pseudouridine synthase [Bacillus badius]KIL77668.1 ribosomal large subunit pseudouridine synthase D like protein [Bacillus badius]MED4718784.1 RluA family pseudouridine synthase [Bacillus badius]
MRFQLIWTAAEQDEGKLLRDFLMEQHVSRRALTDIKFGGGRISVNGHEENVRFQLAQGDKVTVLFPREVPSEGILKEHFPLSVVFEDEYLLVVEKPAGMSTIPSREHPSGSLANGLLGYYEERGIEATVHVVTRLDRDTSGLVLIAKHRHVHHLCSEMQKRNEISRAYEALAEGVISSAGGIIEEPIGRKETSIIEREVRADGQYACTAFKVLQTFPDFTRAALKLRTGRTHQIRVHLSHIGHPLLGDELYGGSLAKIDRQALHCHQLAFCHPITQKPLYFECPLPQDMQAVIDQAGGA